jgi:hypothetical protein
MSIEAVVTAAAASANHVPGSEEKGEQKHCADGGDNSDHELLVLMEPGNVASER